MADSFTYYKMLTGNDVMYGPVKMTITESQSESYEIETFEYAHRENTSSRKFSMFKKISVSGVLKAFNIGAEHSHSFSKASAESLRTGKEMREVSKKYVSKTTAREYTLKDDTFLCQYVPIKVVCFTINEGERQYATIPESSVSVRPVSEADLERLSTGSYLLDKESWGKVSAEYIHVELDNINDAMDQLVPRNIKVNHYAIKTAHDTYLRFRSDRGVVDQQTFIGSHEKFEIVQGDGYVAIKSLAHNTYLRFDKKDSVVDQQTSIGGWEKFEIVGSLEGTFSLRNKYHGTYLRASDRKHIVDQQDYIGPWEKFQAVPIMD